MTKKKKNKTNWIKLHRKKSKNEIRKDSFPTPIPESLSKILLTNLYIISNNHTKILGCRDQNTSRKSLMDYFDLNDQILLKQTPN